MTKPLLVCVVGPTAVGKSAVAVRLAQHYKTELVYADSRMVYRGLSIGTNKPLPNEQQLVPHHLLDVAEPTEHYNAARYIDDALLTLEQIFTRHSLAILSGGTGMYVKALLHGLDDMPTVPQAIKAALRAEHKAHGLEPLLKELERADPAYYNKVDRHNPARILRALEVIRTTGKPFSSFHRQAPTAERPFRHLLIGLQIAREELYERINKRVLLMLQAGLVHEVQALLKKGVPKDSQALSSIGYSEVVSYLEGTYNYERMVELLQQNTRRYAKRQLTWWRKWPGVHWHKPSELPAIIQRVDAARIA